jgi:hypothetical protein
LFVHWISCPLCWHDGWPRIVVGLQHLLFHFKLPYKKIPSCSFIFCQCRVKMVATVHDIVK